MEMLQNILAAIGVVLNGLPQGLLALSYGFASVPTALAFGTGIVGVIFFGSVAPISFQAETITLAGSMGKDLRERLSMVFLSGLIMTVLGVMGLLGLIMGFAGGAVIHGMMAGVGVMLARVAVNMVKDNKLVGGVSLAVGLSIYIICVLTGNPNALVYTIVGCVIISSAAGYFKGQRPPELPSEAMGKLSVKKPVFNISVLRGALAIACLTIGANIAFGGITGSIAGTDVNVDHLTIYSGVASAVSGLFGGGPVEAIISATAAAPDAIISAVIMMALMAVILFSGLLPKIGKYIPAQSIAGFLFVLGALVTVPIEGPMAFSGEAGSPIAGGATLVVTAIVDPFVGMLAGILVNIIGL